MSRKIIIFMVTIAVLVLSLALFSCGEDEEVLVGTLSGSTTNSTDENGGSVFTIECKTQMKPGGTIGFDYKMADNSPIYSKYLTMEIVGLNSVEGEFEFVERDGLTYTYFTAAKKGTVKVQAVYSYPGKKVMKSNVVEISVCINEIASVEEFMAIAGSEDEWELVCDLDFSGIDSWTSIDFSGYLNGNGHKITGLKIDASSTDYLALFGLLKGDVENLIIEDASIKGTGTSYCAGILAGSISGGKVTNVTVSGIVDAPYYNSVGGIVGYCTNGKITSCTNNADIIGSNGVGGIAGLACIDTTEAISDCKNIGLVDGKENVGGVCGTVTAQRATNDFYELGNNENNGVINGISFVGGVFGSVSSDKNSVPLKITDSRNTGEVIGVATGEYVGGIVGVADDLLSMTGCSNNADITGGSYVGGYLGGDCGYGTYIDAGKNRNTNTITGKGMVGGFAGKCGIIKNAINDGEIISTGVLVIDGDVYSYVGGVAGYCKGAYGCENNSDISVSGIGLYVGGVCAYAEVNGIDNFSSNTNRGSVSGYKYVGGVAGTIANTKANTSGNIRVTVCQNIGAVEGHSYVGGIFGQVYGTAGDKSDGVEMFGCTNQGEIVSNQDGEGAGGIVGYAQGLCKMESCENKADVTGGVFVGGVVGFAQGTRINAYGTENNCTIKGTVGVGGIAGYTGVIEYATNKGAIIATGKNEKNNCFAGGIAGYCEGAIGCVNNADVIVENGAGGVGGIAGYVVVSQKAVIYENVNNASVSGGNYVGGVIGVLSCVDGNETYKVFNNHNMGDISGAEGVGGICGYIQGVQSSYFEVTGCVNGGMISGDGLVGGICGKHENLKTDASVMSTNTTVYGEMLGQ